MQPKTLAFFGTLFGTLALDQATKIWVYTQLEYRTEHVSVVPGLLDIVHAQNKAAMMGFMEGVEGRMVLFLGFTVLATVLIGWFWSRLRAGETFVSFILGLILSGALGNGIDRAHKQSVTDWIRFYTTDDTLIGLVQSAGLGRFCNPTLCEWPAFNIADSCLVVGLLLFFAQYAFSADEGVEDDDEDELPAESAG